MELYTIDGGNFLCDGGGIFGGVPKLLWSRQIKADDRNLIKLTMRCLLVVHDDRKILIETGAGTKLSWKFIENNGIENADILIDSIRNAGFTPDEITDVVHTHLHWDHCGGGTIINDKKEVIPTFQNAKYHVTRSHWENAMNPNPREGDAFFSDDLLPIEKAGLLNLIEEECELIPGFEMRIFNGHTPGQIIPIISYKNKKLVYISDLVPLVANIPTKWISAYDLYPVTSMEEKQSFLKEAYDENYILFFEHDIKFECASLKWNEKKGAVLDKTGKLSEFI
ncbi:MAG: MBL fold metallo-hydrolase [Prolixibacteraceae bacterium]|jgi:glyoxylase-like metal-dependent hydrolase (beta-lactamase superfamily II)|nr:MBL fold metallo-hydrolase [Prolixibacteraceae bacterium]